MSNNSQLNKKPWMPGITKDKEHESDIGQTNFKTIEETKAEIKKAAERDLDNLGELYNIFQEICRGKDPMEVIRTDRVLTNRSLKEYRNMVEHVENAFGIIEEYRMDIESIKSKEGFTIMADPEDRKTHEFLSENLEDER